MFGSEIIYMFISCFHCLLRIPVPATLQLSFLNYKMGNKMEKITAHVQSCDRMHQPSACKKKL